MEHGSHPTRKVTSLFFSLLRQVIATLSLWTEVPHPSDSSASHPDATYHDQSHRFAIRPRSRNTLYLYYNGNPIAIIGRTDGRTTQVGSGGFSWLDSKSVAWQRHGENGWLARGTVICKRNCSFFRLGGRYSSNLVTAKLKLLQSPIASSTARSILTWKCWPTSRTRMQTQLIVYRFTVLKHLVRV